MSSVYNLSQFVDNISQRHKDKQADVDLIWNAIRNAISINQLINNLAEVFRLSPDQIERDLEELGFSDLIVQFKLKNNRGKSSEEAQTHLNICSKEPLLDPFPDLFKVKAKPNFVDPIPVSKSQKETFSNLFQSVLATVNGDPFLKLYREGVLDYFNEYMTNNALQISNYISKNFNEYPKYLVTTGIGANEQFNHFVANINNNNNNRRLTWFIVNSPKKLSALPDDASIDNTLFMEFSRSSITEETVKIHEYTPRQAKRVVFCNGGPLLALGKRDSNLIQSLPDQVSGRYGRNKTTILLAPMHVAGMDVEAFWKDIDLAINTFDLTDPDSLPVIIAKYIYLYQKQKDRNLMYLGCNDDNLIALGDEFVQFWNEGVNKGGNDFMVSRFFGLPRDSHMNIEGLLGNHETKMAFFLLRTNMRTDKLHPLVSPIIDPVNAEHEGLNFGDEEVILSVANRDRFSDLMPTMTFEIPHEPSLKHAAIISQIFSDVTFVYSRFNNIDPGSNPEVKAVRTRSAKLLSSVAEKIRSGVSIDKAVIE